MAGYRRAREEAQDSAQWRRFLEDNADLITRSPVPLEVMHSRALWNHFLSHGFVDVGGGTHFSAHPLGDLELDLLKQLIVAYLAAGLPDLLSIWGTKTDDQLRQAAGR